MRGFSSVILSIALLASCSDSETDTNDLASQTFPTDLAITSPLANGSAVEGLVKLSTRAQTSSDTNIPLPFDEKKDEISKRLIQPDISGCGFTSTLFRPAKDVTCYGPSISYENHQDFNYSVSGVLPNGDVGIWDENEGSTGEACIAAKLNGLIGTLQGQLDTAVNLFTGMLCAANAGGEDVLPLPSETKNFLSVLTDAKLPYDLTTATISREKENDTGGHPIYIYEMAGKGIDSKAIAIHLHLKHIPLNKTNSVYKGRLWYTLNGPLADRPLACQVTKQLRQFAVSILYEKSSKGVLLYRLKRAEYCSDKIDPFDSNNDVDSASNWVSQFSDGTFQIDTSKETGSFSYAWQAGTPDDNSRTILAEINSNGNGGRSGCGYFGFGPRVQDTNVGNIDGMICNWAGPGAVHVVQPIVQRQCVTYNSTKKQFVSDPDTSRITYAPTNACDSFDDGFVFDGNPGPLTNNLLPIADMQLDVSVPPRPGQL